MKITGTGYVVAIIFANIYRYVLYFNKLYTYARLEN